MLVGNVNMFESKVLAKIFGGSWFVWRSFINCI